jgi:N-carbamoylputrescine amidase
MQKKRASHLPTLNSRSAIPANSFEQGRRAMKYQIKIPGRLDPGWSAQLGGLEISSIEENGTVITRLTGYIADQPALFGILEGIRDMNLLPISVEQIDEENHQRKDDMTPTNERPKTIRVAAVQMQSRLGCIADNLEHASPLVEQAARQGAQLVVLPELAASGYSLSSHVWQAAETYDGPTLFWLRNISAKLGLYVGIGFVEAEGKDFYNSYAIGAPDGQIAGVVRKSNPEVNIFRPDEGPHVIATPLARIGIGICADNLFVANLIRMQQYSADLLLMPHAAPLPFKVGGPIKEEDLPEGRLSMSTMAPAFAQRIGLPTVFVNQVGPRGREKWDGIFGAVMSPDAWRLGGLSTIADQDGRILGQMDELEEGVIVAEVTLDESRKVKTRPVGHGTYGGGFVTPHPAIFEGICYVDAFFGRLSYQLRIRRRQIAAGVSSNASDGTGV